MSAPPPRRGPRPLLLHLTLAMLKSSASLGVSPSWSGASPIWSAAAIEEVRRIIAGLPEREDASPSAVLAEALRQDRDLIAGIAAYRRHPWRRDLPDPPAIWSEGETRLLDYGGEGPPLFIVPSLVNRGYVLDLAPGHSMARFLAAQGARVLLLDWGWPAALERTFTLTDYVAGRLERALQACGRPVVLVGYCMGGLLTAAAAQRRPDLVHALALLATPWDFHASGSAEPRALARLLPVLEPLIANANALPIDALQVMFAMLEPYGVGGKYRSFGKLDPAGERARLFVALEDWLNDGVPLAAPVARECLRGWYGANTPAQREWRIAGQVVEPAGLRMPTLVVAPARDRIVPGESARPLAAAIPGAKLLEPSAGHIGMVAGSSAERALWRPLLDWVVSVAGAKTLASGASRPKVRRRGVSPA
ncbi:MAG TPA: alpha/beta fold hydrolase [Acetobacteraceae bacterium]|jgi:pimeloyl-ACP methyl ester carboxylesterase|nr:alpha/beta fold hydrolase [Acetobacteraceae bacterium]